MISCLLSCTLIPYFVISFVVASIAVRLAPIFKAVIIGIAVIILLPRLIAAAPVIIVLAILGALVNKVKRIVG